MLAHKLRKQERDKRRELKVVKRNMCVCVCKRTHAHIQTHKQTDSSKSHIQLRLFKASYRLHEQCKSAAIKSTGDEL
jgi:hypothetical protein